MTNKPAPPPTPTIDPADGKLPPSRAANEMGGLGLQPREPRPSRSIEPTPRRAPGRVEAELEVLIRARYPILYVVTWEEERLERQLSQVAEQRNKKLFVWSYTQGIVKYGTEPQRTKSGAGNTSDPIAALDAVIAQVEPAIYLFKDFHPFMEDNRCNLAVVRRLRDVAYHLRDTYKTLVVSAPQLRFAPELSKDVTVLEYDLPGEREFGQLLDRIIDDIRDKPRLRVSLDGDARERLLHAARGLTLKEAENVLAKTLVLHGKIDADDLGVVLSEKQQIIKKSGLLEYYESREEFGQVAGLENLKTWLGKRAMAFMDRATAFGLPAPRGVMLLGVQGCGKSLCAKAVSSLWKMPLLRFDVGQVFSGLVGSSEDNMRRAIKTAESVAPAILWVDEVDKAFKGTQDTGGSDGGTSARVFGTFLTWLSEKTSPVFVIATANDISHLPPELLRKGRLDEIFYVDLPTDPERREILKIHLAKRGRDPARFDLDRLARLADGFSGAEIEEAVVSALFDAFSRDTEISTEILETSLGETVPLSKTMSEELNRLRTWALGRARPASGTIATVPTELRRKIEL